MKTVTTPDGQTIPLFGNYVFSKHAYPRKCPAAQIVCPQCGGINSGRYDATSCICADCGATFNPQNGPADRDCVSDSRGQRHRIRNLVTASGAPPSHRLYAIMALTGHGRQKSYLKPTQFDFDLFAEASRDLADADLPIPDMPIRPGYNTDQARSYNYRNWRQFFNDRQLLCLGILLKRIAQIRDRAVREHLLCLFSGTLEFNSVFCSFKGEGTGSIPSHITF